MAPKFRAYWVLVTDDAVTVNRARVVTLGMVDQVHNRPDGTARRNFNNHRNRLTEGQHFLRMSADEIRTRFPGLISDRATEDVTLLTERGYLMLVKSFTDDLAWEVQDRLVERYFKASADNGTPEKVARKWPAIPILFWRCSRSVRRRSGHMYL